VQGLDQRFTASAVTFMRSLLEAGLEQVVQSAAPLVVLPRFNGVYLTDCTRLVWGANCGQAGSASGTTAWAVTSQLGRVA